MAEATPAIFTVLIVLTLGVIAWVGIWGREH